MSKIELGLHEHHASYQASNSSSNLSPAPSSSRAVGGSSNGVNFAKVNSVVDGSPAAEAGMKAGDRIRMFGDVTWINHERLSKVAETVQRNQGVSRRPSFLGTVMLIYE